MATERLRNAHGRFPDPGAALARELEHALGLLASGKVDDRVAHEVRRSTKRARALLRLMRDAVGQAAYVRENRALRDAARSLAPMRDAKVLRAALAGIGIRARVPRVAAPAVAPIATALSGVRRRVTGWRMPQPRWPLLAGGIERVYRQGRKAVRAAGARPTDGNLHESRKQVKHLGAALAFLEPAGARKVRKLAKRADAVAADLGDDHDLALLARTRLDTAVRDRLRRRRRELQKRALKEAGRLFQARPEKFLKRLSRARTGA